MIGRQMGTFYTISSLLLAGKSAFCYVINAICYAIGRLRRECYLPALKIQQRCDKSASYFLLFSTSEKSALRVFKHGPLFIFKFCSHGRLFKRALNQDRAVKRAYTVNTNSNFSIFCKRLLA